MNDKFKFFIEIFFTQFSRFIKKIFIVVYIYTTMISNVVSSIFFVRVVYIELMILKNLQAKLITLKSDYINIIVMTGKYCSTRYACKYTFDK